MEEKIDNAKNKAQQARLMGVKIPDDDYWGDYTSKTCGSVGGASSENFIKDSNASFKQKSIDKDK